MLSLHPHTSYFVLLHILRTDFDCHLALEASLESILNTTRHFYPSECDLYSLFESYITNSRLLSKRLREICIMTEYKVATLDELPNETCVSDYSLGVSFSRLSESFKATMDTDLYFVTN